MQTRNNLCDTLLHPDISRTKHNTLLILPLLAFLVRAGFGFAQYHQPLADPDQYLPFASSIALGEGFIYNGKPTAYRPPLYPLVLAPLVAGFGNGQLFRACLILVQACMGGITTWFAMNMAQKLSINFPSEKKHSSQKFNRVQSWLGPPQIAGFLTAFDPLLLSQSSLLMTETLAALTLTLSLHAVISGQTKRAGIFFGLAALCRPSLLACTATVLAVRLISPLKTDLYGRIHETLCIAFFCFVIIFPWGLRNWRIFGVPVWTTTHGGYTFALANNPVYYEEVLFGPKGSVWTGKRQQAWMDSVGPETAGMSEPEADKYLKKETLKFVASHPMAFAYACLDRQIHFWALAPSSAVYSSKIRFFCMLWTLPFWFLVLISILQKRTWSWPAISIVAAISGLAAVHLFYWTDIRMRTPLVPLLAVLASQVFYSELLPKKIND